MLHRLLVNNLVVFAMAQGALPMSKENCSLQEEVDSLSFS